MNHNGGRITARNQWEGNYWLGVDLGTQSVRAVAAMTEATAYFSSEEPGSRTFEMIVDRPFFFVICDNYTNTILFMGSVEEPRS